MKRKQSIIEILNQELDASKTADLAERIIEAMALADIEEMNAERKFREEMYEQEV